VSVYLPATNLLVILTKQSSSMTAFLAAETPPDSKIGSIVLIFMTFRKLLLKTSALQD
tara:strand:+ start:541 stop:714 length:174 start_codon:yes stop_codon:yes gene_type:complete